MRTINDEGIIIKITPLNDNDKIFEILSKENGKISLIAKGVNKVKSRKAGILDLLNQIKFKFIPPKNELGLIIEANLIDDYRQLKTDLNIINVNFYFLELINKFINSKEDARAVYKMSIEFLKQESINVENAIQILISYQLKLLDHLGYSPSFNECTICGEEIKSEDEIYISSSEIPGYICHKHRQSNDESINYTLIKIQKFNLENSLLMTLRLKLNSEQIKQLFNIQNFWLQNIIGKKFNTTDIMNQIINKL